MSNQIVSVLKRSVGYGKVRSQWFFEKMYLHAIYGMNYSSPNHFENGEKEAIRYAAQKLHSRKRAADVIFDVGANIGEYAKELRTGFGVDSRIYCFEPGAAAFEKLLENTHQDRGISAHQFGLGETEGTFTLFFDKPESTIASLYDLPTNHPWKGDRTEQVEIQTLDHFCRDNAISHINFLKIDVEGHEIQVLKGASEMLASNQIDYIQFEFGFRQMDSHGYFRDFYHLLDENYRLFRIVQDGVSPIEKYHESLEVFVGVSNFLAENRSLS